MLQRMLHHKSSTSIPAAGKSRRMPPIDERAQAFWRKTMDNYVSGSRVKEFVAARDDNEKLIFQFDSSLASLK